MKSNTFFTANTTRIRTISAWTVSSGSEAAPTNRPAVASNSRSRDALSCASRGGRITFRRWAQKSPEEGNQESQREGVESREQEARGHRGQEYREIGTQVLEDAEV